MPAKEPAYDRLLKLIILGDSHVGKSNLLYRFCEGTLGPNMSTIGIDFKIRTVEMEGVPNPRGMEGVRSRGPEIAASPMVLRSSRDLQRVKLQIWDTASGERFRTTTQAYCRGVHGVLLVYSVTNRKSFENIANHLSWFRSIHQESALE